MGSIRNNTVAASGTAHPTASTLVECQNACDFDHRCVAVDWKSSDSTCVIFTDPHHYHPGSTYPEWEHHELVSRCSITPGQWFDSNVHRIRQYEYTKNRFKQESRAIAGRTAWCRCEFRYVLKFTAASRGFHCNTVDCVCSCSLVLHCGHLINRKISKIGATRCQILRLKCTRFAFRWGSCPDPAGGAYNTPGLLAVFKRPISKGRGEGQGKWRRRRRKG